MFSLKITNVVPAREYTTSVNCTKNCSVLSAGVKMNCTTTTDVSYAYAHVKLPTGWFLICGMSVNSYVPVNGSGGPCSLGRLTVFWSPQKSPLCLRSPTWPRLDGTSPLYLIVTVTCLFSWTCVFNHICNASHGNLFEHRNKQSSLSYGKSFECHLTSHQCH